MGNSQGNLELQRDGFFSALPEDIMILLTDILPTRDFVHLTMTCKYYHQDLLGGNNALWARVCKSLGGIDKILKELNQSRGMSDLKSLDLTDKSALVSIDFKREIFTYYILSLNHQLLRDKMDEYFFYSEANTIVKVHPFSFWTNLSQYWTKVDLKNGKFPRDYFYEVDLTYDPTSVEETSEKILPHELGGRLVVYKKSKRKAPTYGDLMSRTEHYEAEEWERIQKELDEIQKMVDVT